MSGEHRNATENKAMMKICAFIVDKRNLFFLLFALAIAFSAVPRLGRRGKFHFGVSAGHD